MQNLIIATSSLNQTALDFDGNRQRIGKALEIAKESQAHVLALPELAVCGYGCEDEFFSIDLCRKSEDSVKELLPKTKGLMTAFGVPIYLEGGLYNCAVIVKDEKIIGITAKKYLAREGVHYEPRWFTPWRRGRATEIDFAGQESIPFGDLYFKVGNVGVGVEICEEAWGPESPVDTVSGACEVILNLSASHFSLGKNEIRRQLVADSSRSLCVFYAYSNLIGVDSGKIIYDGATYIGFNGKILSEGKRFSFNEVNVDICPADLNLVRVNKIRQHSSSLRSAREDINGRPQLVEVESFSIGDAHLEAFHMEPYGAMTNERELHDALTLGLFDYARKTHSKGYVVSLSGGCDSSSCAYLVASMVHKVVSEIGVKDFSEKFGLDLDEKKLDPIEDISEIVSKVLTCVYQASENSGEVTEEAAEELAKELGASYYKSSIADVVSSFRKQAEDYLNRKLDWKTDDLALQNIQARARAPFPWMLANVNNQILITTSNRSEASVGYATMDGDSAGGLAPLAGIDKAFLRKWLVWAESKNDSGIGKVKALSYVNDQQPTAELRPAKMKQTDENDLMPYEILNQIERYMVRDKMSSKEIVAFISKDYSDLDYQTIMEYVSKFRKMWRRNQWKRERFAPSFHLDTYSVDSNSWCRFPIISGS